MGHLDGTGPVGNFRLDIQQTENPASSCHSLLNGAVDVADSLAWLVDHQQSGKEGQKGTGRRLSCDDLMAAIKYDGRNPDAAKRLHERRLQAVHFDILDNYPEKFVHQFRKSPFLIFFHAKGLYDPLAGDGLVQGVGDEGDGLLIGIAQFSKFPAEVNDGEKGDGQRKDGKEGHLPVEVKNDPHQADNLKKVL